MVVVVGDVVDVLLLTSNVAVFHIENVPDQGSKGINVGPVFPIVRVCCRVRVICGD